jgi:hypothetical protein
VAQVFTGDLCRLGKPFATLPNRIQRNHFVRGAPLIAAKLDGRASAVWVTATHDDLARRLSSVCSPTAVYELVWEAFADTRGNPGPDVVRDFLCNFGVESWVEKFNSFASPPWNWNTVRVHLTSFLALRNECAHTGNSSAIPSPSSIEGHCEMIGAISDTIAKVLEEHLRVL